MNITEAVRLVKLSEKGYVYNVVYFMSGIPSGMAGPMVKHTPSASSDVLLLRIQLREANKLREQLEKELLEALRAQGGELQGSRLELDAKEEELAVKEKERAATDNAETPAYKNLS